MKNIIIGLLNNIFPAKLKRKIIGSWLKDDDIRLWCKEKLIHPNDLFMNRFIWSDIHKTIQIIEERFGKKYPLIIITDREDKPVGINLPVICFKDLNEGIIRSQMVVICAFNSDEKLVSALHKITKLPEVYYYCPFRLLPTARYFHRNDQARDILISDYFLKHGKFDLADFENIIQAIDITSKLEGAYVEIGVYRGDSAHLAMNYMKQKKLERTCFFFDLFEGFTNETSQKSGDSVWANTHSDTSLEAVKTYLGEFSNIVIEKLDIIESNLPETIQKIAVCNIDVDIYEATFAALIKVAPLMVKGGIILVEDQGHTPLLAGAYLAVYDFLNSSAAQNLIPVHLDSGQMYFIKI